jgi:curved DNA-binding protein CbpA
VPESTAPVSPARALSSDRPEPDARASTPDRPRPRVSTPPRARESNAVRPSQIPPPPGGLQEKHTEQWEEIRKFARKIDNLNYFEMLGITDKATTAEVTSAFFTLAKKWHPDRLPAELKDLKPHVELIFGYMNEANQCLRDERNRDQYLQNVREGGGTPATDRLVQKVIEGAMSFPKVEVLARLAEYDEALELLDKIIKNVGEEPEYLAMRAHLLMLKHPGEGAPLEEMLRDVTEALGKNNEYEMAHFYRGQILKRMGNHQEALKHFKKAVELNPRNVDAGREVRLASMRGGEEGGDSGLLGKLFGKK